MPTDKTPLDRVPLEIELSEAVIRELERLLQTGLYGFTIKDVAERIICIYLVKNKVRRKS